MKRYAILVAVLMLLLAGVPVVAGADAPGGAAPSTAARAAGPQPSAAVPPPAVAAQDYRISAGDTISVVVWGQDKLSQSCQVNASGTISYPLLGDIPAAGSTCAELQARLTEGLQGYLKRPQVLVSISSYGTAGMSVFVLGEVKSPGVYPIVGANGLMQVIAAAGGVTPQASGQITIIRARTGEPYVTGVEQVVAFGGDPRARPEPGDVVLVNRRDDADEPRRYTVLGEVPSPGVFDMPDEGEAHVLDAMQRAGLLAAGGPGDSGARSVSFQDRFPLADLAHARLTREEAVVPLDLAALLAGDTSQNLPLQSGDVITVRRRQVIAVNAMGEVRSPGKQLLPLNSTILDLLTAVGGVTSAANVSQASLLRQSNGAIGRVALDLRTVLGGGNPAKNVPIQDGDILVVPTRGERRSIWQWLPLVPYLWRN